MKLKFIRYTFLFTLLFLTVSKTMAISLPLTLPALKPNWQRLNIENVGTIDMPPIMEVQSQNYKELSSTILDYINSNNNCGISKPTYDIILQPKGVNNLSNEDKYYARVMVGTDIGLEGDFLPLDTSLEKFNNNQPIHILQKETKNYIESSVNTWGSKILKWFEPSIEKVNGMPAMKYSYIRQFGSNPQVYVEFYQFQNYDRLHDLTISYRIQEKEIWEPVISKVLSSFRITNIKKSCYGWTITNTNPGLNFFSPIKITFTELDVTSEFLSLLPRYYRPLINNNIIMHTSNFDSLSVLIRDEFTFSINYITGYKDILDIIGGVKSALNADLKETLSILRTDYGQSVIKSKNINEQDNKWEIKYEYYDTELQTKIYGITQGRIVNNVPYYINVEYFKDGKEKAERFIQNIR